MVLCKAFTSKASCSSDKWRLISRDKDENPLLAKVAQQNLGVQCPQSYQNLSIRPHLSFFLVSTSSK